MEDRGVALVVLFGLAVCAVGFAWILIQQVRSRGATRLWLATAAPQEVNRLLIALIVLAALSLGLTWLGYTRLQARLAVLAAEAQGTAPDAR